MEKEFEKINKQGDAFNNSLFKGWKKINYGQLKKIIEEEFKDNLIYIKQKAPNEFGLRR